MAAIDPNLQVVSPQIKNPLDFAIQGAQLQALTASGQRQQVEAAQARRSYEDESLIRQVSQQSMVDDPANPGQKTLDPSLLIAGLKSSRNPLLADKVAQAHTAAVLDTQQQRLGVENNALMGMYDEASYHRNADALVAGGYPDVRQQWNAPDYNTAVLSGNLQKARMASLTAKQQADIGALQARGFSEVGGAQAAGANAGVVQPSTVKFGQMPGGQGLPPPQAAPGQAPQPQGGSLPAQPPGGAMPTKPAGKSAQILPNGLPPDQSLETRMGKIKASVLWKMNPADLVKDLPVPERDAARKELNDSLKVAKAAPLMLTYMRDAYDTQKHGVGGNVKTGLGMANADMNAFNSLAGTTIASIDNSVRQGLFKAMEEKSGPNPRGDAFEKGAKETRDQALINYAMQAGDSEALRSMGIDPNWFKMTNVKAAMDAVPMQPHQAQQAAAKGWPVGATAKTKNGKTVVHQGGGKWQEQ